MKELDGYPSPASPTKKSYERPHWAGRIRSNTNLNTSMPTDALMAGYELRELTFMDPWEGDPWYLYDKDGRIIHEWLFKPPSLAEVFEICSKHLSV